MDNYISNVFNISTNAKGVTYFYGWHREFFFRKKRIKTQKLILCIKLQSNFNQRRETKIKANLLILCLYSLKINKKNYESSIECS